MGRQKFARYLTEEDRSIILSLLTEAVVWVEPMLSVTDCRDAKDNKYLVLTAAAGAEIIISSDNDLLVLDPWRGTRIVDRPEVLCRLRGVADIGGPPISRCSTD